MNFYEKYNFLPQERRMTKRPVEMIIHALRDVQSQTKRDYPNGWLA